MKQKLDGLQIARALAALSVAYFHSKTAIAPLGQDYIAPIKPLLSYGFYGVDFFFAVSGFVVCIVTERDPDDRIGFLIKRVFRIYPPWILACTLFVMFGGELLQNPTWRHILTSYTLIPMKDFPILDVGWSLQHEIAFYILAILVVPIFRVAGLLIVLLAVSLAAHIVVLPWWLNNFAAYYPAFAAGIVAFWLSRRLTRWQFPMILGVVLIVAILTMVTTPRLYLPVAWALILTGFALMPVRSIVGTTFVRLGDASYSLYLLHPVVFAIIYNLASRHPLPSWVAEPLRWAALLAVCVVAWCAWILLEKPINKFGHSLAKRVSSTPNRASSPAATKPQSSSYRRP